LSLLAGIVFGVVPAFRATRIDIGSAIGTSAQKGGSGGAVVRKCFLVAQVSASLVLLAGAGLFIGTVRNLQNVNVGFNPNELVIFDVSARFPRGDSDQFVQFYDRLIQNISALPGTQSVTMSSTRTFTGGGFFGRVVVDGPESSHDDIQILAVGDRFFETLEIPVAAGRSLLQTDRANTPKVAVINERAAKLFFPDGRFLGGRLRFSDETSTFEVVGVVRDTKYSSLRDNPSPAVFFPFAQRVRPSMTLTVRTQIEPAAAIESIVATVRRVDSNLPISRITTQTAQIREIMAIERSFAFFSGIFSIVALTLAAIGLYGVVAYTVNRRTSEIGLRIALGARRHDILRLVMQEMFVVLLAGTTLGLAGSLVVTRFIEEILYGVTRYDLATMATAVAVMAAASAFAAFVPAWRASRVDPMIALRYE
jgi:predicted permease